ncbi:citramalyl-CoA lyase, mitochondrial [Brachyhypopomus gauderio]|uniref:citramalyl-CoA lyase, mitochondrial n=1 Tax=Brachyhypopomus gauderio TaxID=698409 RepID=UPI00404262BB
MLISDGHCGLLVILGVVVQHLLKLSTAFSSSTPVLGMTGGGHAAPGDSVHTLERWLPYLQHQPCLHTAGERPSGEESVSPLRGPQREATEVGTQAPSRSTRPEAQARETVARMLAELDLGRTEKCVRVNSPSSGLADADLEAVLRAEVLPTALMLPKVEDGVELQWFVDRFQWHLKDRKLKEPIRLVTFVETAVGLLNFKAVCEEARRLGPAVGLHHDGVVFGSDDFCASIGATRTRDARELLYARQKVVVTTKAFGLQAIDLVYIDYQDGEGLRQQAREGALMGFTGKQVIHPSQVQAVQEEFSPSPERVKWATELIAAFEEHQRLGKGAFAFHGSMIDMPSLKQAQNLVALETAIRGK